MKLKLAIMSLLFTINLMADYVKPNFSNYYADISKYIDMENCNKLNREIFEVCYNYEKTRVQSGWAIISSEYMDKVNIIKRPNFYKDRSVFTLAPSVIKDPIHKGHTFVTDSDFDFDNTILRYTYNMLNIVPMIGKTNVGSWRKVELRGRLLALQVGEILSITKIYYDPISKFDIPVGKFPTHFQRIYIGENIEECYETQNIGVSGITLNEQKIDCEKLLGETDGN
jgi:DNA/RNA endonuclease G (NUC1)